MLQDMREIVWAAAPQLWAQVQSGSPLRGEEEALYRKLWSEIKPVKYGSTALWTAAFVGLATSFARYQVPRNFSHIVMRTEMYVVNETAGAANRQARLAPPRGLAYWQYERVGGTSAQIITDQFMPIPVMLNAEEFLIFSGGNDAVLIGNLAAAPAADTGWYIETVVYGYNCGAAITELIGSNQAIAQITADI